MSAKYIDQFTESELFRIVHKGKMRISFVKETATCSRLFNMDNLTLRGEAAKDCRFYT